MEFKTLNKANDGKYYYYYQFQSKDKGYTNGWACKRAPQKGQVQDKRTTHKYKNNKVVQKQINTKQH